jgi:hypothetical protein
MAKGLRALSRSVPIVLDARRGRLKAQPMGRSHPYNNLTFPVPVQSQHSRRTGASRYDRSVHDDRTVFGRGRTPEFHGSWP